MHTVCMALHLVLRNLHCICSLMKNCSRQLTMCWRHKFDRHSTSIARKCLPHNLCMKSDPLHLAYFQIFPPHMANTCLMHSTRSFQNHKFQSRTGYNLSWQAGLRIHRLCTAVITDKCTRTRMKHTQYVYMLYQNAQTNFRA